MSRLHFPRSYYIPERSTVVRSKVAEAVVYFGVSMAGKLWALGFRGKADKPSFNYTFRTEERRAQYIAEFFASCEATEAARSARRAQRKAFRHSLKVGDILSNSWGYDQTNTEFYEVVQLVGDTMCVLRELCCQSEQDGFLSETIVPMPGHYRENKEPLRRRIQDGGVNIYGASFGWARLYHRPEPGKLSIMPPRHVSHTH